LEIGAVKLNTHTLHFFSHFFFFFLFLFSFWAYRSLGRI
jgi:hypothetical protein